MPNYIQRQVVLVPKKDDTPSFTLDPLPFEFKTKKEFEEYVNEIGRTFHNTKFKLIITNTKI